jgi:hypothetical protein
MLKQSSVHDHAPLSVMPATLACFAGAFWHSIASSQVTY